MVWISGRSFIGIKYYFEGGGGGGLYSPLYPVTHEVTIHPLSYGKAFGNVVGHLLVGEGFYEYVLNTCSNYNVAERSFAGAHHSWK